MPVYDATALTLTAIHRVLEAKVRSDFRFLVIDDGSRELELRMTLAGLSEQGLIDLRVNAENRGFTATANVGFQDADSDLLLLNSDTEVFDGWLDRLDAVAKGSRNVATVTPLSNAATIFSYPVTCHENDNPLEIGPEHLDRLAAGLNFPPVEAPTGVGFCMFVSSAAKAAIGQLDHNAFPRGYGEENDFCRRAVARGLKNLAATNTFVRHVGGASFGRERRSALVSEGLETMQRLHPGYAAIVDEFRRHDPLATVRQGLDLARLGAMDRTGRARHAVVTSSSGLRMQGRLRAPLSVALEGVSAESLPNLRPPDPRDDRVAATEYLLALGVGSVSVHVPWWARRRRAAGCALAHDLRRRLADAAATSLSAT